MNVKFISVDFQKDFSNPIGKNFNKGKSVDFIKNVFIPYCRENHLIINEIISDYRHPRPSKKGDGCSCIPGTEGYKSEIPVDIKNKNQWIKCMNNPIWTRKNAGIANKQAGIPYQDPEGFNKWLEETIGTPSETDLVVLIGLTMECCVFCTGQELFFRGYNVKILYEGTDPMETGEDYKNNIIANPPFNIWNNIIRFDELKEYIKQEKELNEKPNFIKKYGYDFPKDTKKVWELDIPVEDLDINEITWHFELPFWNYNDIPYSVKPIDVMKYKDKYSIQYERIINADTSYPIDLIDDRKRTGKLLILDGLHRLAKLYLEGASTVKVRIVPRTKIPYICKDNTLIDNLKNIFENNKDKRICVIGTTCTGKTTLVNIFEESEDMDKLIFPKLTKEEMDYVCQTPWTEKIGNTMNNLVRTRLNITPGNPLFGTVLLDCDLIVYLHISDDKLLERTSLRNVDFTNAKNMQTKIEKEIKESNIEIITLEV